MESNVKFVSKEYRKLNEKLHKHSARRRKAFGADGSKWIKILQPIMQKLKIQSLLDYGCGKEKFWEALKESYSTPDEPPMYVGYDPCVVGKTTPPIGKFEMVVCTDVLEHVEPEYLDNVLRHIEELSNKMVFFNIALLPAVTLLPDGSNAHRIVETHDWWCERLICFFPLSRWKWQEIKSDKPYKRFQLMLEKL